MPEVRRKRAFWNEKQPHVRYIFVVAYVEVLWQWVWFLWSLIESWMCVCCWMKRRGKLILPLWQCTHENKSYTPVWLPVRYVNKLKNLHFRTNPKPISIVIPWKKKQQHRTRKKVIMHFCFDFFLLYWHSECSFFWPACCFLCGCSSVLYKPSLSELL